MNKFVKVVQDIKNMSVSKKIIAFLIFIFFMFLLSVAWSPLHKWHELEHLVNQDSLYNSAFDPVWNHPEIVPLLRQKANKEALLKLSEKDSIQLALSLSDSTVCLYLKGVRIHQTRVRTIELDYLLKKMSPRQYGKIFSQVLEIKQQDASIVKEPVVVRQAPKNTEEAETNAWKPDTLIQNPAFLLLTLEHGIKLIFEQEENSTTNDKWVKFTFYMKIWCQQNMSALRRFVSLEKQVYYPTIMVQLPAEDLRAIYRALPQNGYVVMQF